MSSGFGIRLSVSSGGLEAFLLRVAGFSRAEDGVDLVGEFSHDDHDNKGLEETGATELGPEVRISTISRQAAVDLRSLHNHV